MAELLSMLQSADRVRYQAVLYAPEHARLALCALHLYALELERIPHLVREPMAGEIRLKWWQEVLKGKRDGEAAANPIAQALLDAALAHQLPRQALANMAEARVFDLYSDPMPDVKTLEGYCGELFAVPYQLSIMIIAPESAQSSADLAGHAGMVTGIVAILARLSTEKRQMKCSVPREILAASGLDLDVYFSAEDTKTLVPAVEAMQALGRDHLRQFIQAYRAANDLPRAAFLPLAKDEPMLTTDPAKLLAGGAQASTFRTTFAMAKRAFLGW